MIGLGYGNGPNGRAPRREVPVREGSAPRDRYSVWARDLPVDCPHSRGCVGMKNAPRIIQRCRAHTRRSGDRSRDGFLAERHFSAAKNSSNTGAMASAAMCASGLPGSGVPWGRMSQAPAPSHLSTRSSATVDYGVGTVTEATRSVGSE